jgi:hypothetical protein
MHGINSKPVSIARMLIQGVPLLAAAAAAVRGRENRERRRRRGERGGVPELDGRC